jgi:TRAP-type C4-dicarboxylate transport system permease large subunit
MVASRSERETSGLPGELVNIFDNMNLPAIGMVLAVCTICIFLGMIFESVGLLLLIVPVFLPTLILMEVGLVWFGIVMVLALILIFPAIAAGILSLRCNRSAKVLRTANAWPSLVVFRFAVGPRAPTYSENR